MSPLSVYWGSWAGLSVFRAMTQRKMHKVFFCIFGANCGTMTGLDGYFHLAKTPAQSWISLFRVFVTHALLHFCSSSFIAPKKLNWMYPEAQSPPVFASSCTGNVARHFLLEVKKYKMTGSYRSDVFNL